jgi:hypothetical protein
MFKLPKLNYGHTWTPVHLLVFSMAAFVLNSLLLSGYAAVVFFVWRALSAALGGPLG